MLGTKCLATDDKIGVSTNIGIILTFTVINTFMHLLPYYHSFPCGSDNEEYACKTLDSGLIPETGRSPGEGNGNPLQYSCLENSMDRGAWWAAIHEVTNSWIQLSNFTSILSRVIWQMKLSFTNLPRVNQTVRIQIQICFTLKTCFYYISYLSVTSVQLLSHVQHLAIPWTAAHQASLSITSSQSLQKLMSTESVMPSNHLILCRPLLLPSIFPSTRMFSNESALHIRWPKYWSFSFNISPSNEHPGLISFKMDWLDLLAVQETLKSLLQHHSSKV